MQGGAVGGFFVRVPSIVVAVEDKGCAIAVLPLPARADVSVAVPIINTDAVRMPEIMAGNAIGNSIRHNACHRDKPNAVCASLMAGSIWRKPR